MVKGLYNTSLGIAALIGAFIASAFGFRPLLWVMFIFSIIALAISTELLKEEKKHGRSKKRRIHSNPSHPKR